MRILLTNDDSHRSPLLEIALRYFSRFGEVQIVVPYREQSWTAKSMTRFNPLRVHEIEVFGRSAVAVDGTPADCVNIGVYNLNSEPPDLIVSGINAGFNMGLGFVLSSGTVGACLEGNIAGIPAIALSQSFDTETRNRYVDDYLIAPERIAVFESNTIKVLDILLEILLSKITKSHVLSTPITWNVNFPFELTDPVALKVATLGTARYARTFGEDLGVPGGSHRTFRHERFSQVPDHTPNTDSAIIQSGCAALTPLNMWSLCGHRQPKIVGIVTKALASRQCVTSPLRDD